MVLLLKLCISDKKDDDVTPRGMCANNPRFFFYIIIKCISYFENNNTSNINYFLAIFTQNPSPNPKSLGIRKEEDKFIRGFDEHY